MTFSTFGAGNPPAARETWSGLSTNPLASAQPVYELQDFGLLSNTDGWILLGRHLYWTGSNGANWSDITPPVPTAATILAVKFIDARIGWVLWSTSEANGNLVFQIAHTSDRGGAWNTTVVQTLAPDDPGADIENASMNWLNENTGWVSVKTKTGSNFSSGTLFRTQDGGRTWLRSSLPIGGPVYFMNGQAAQVGWLAGGPAGDQLYKTQDGGTTWEKQTVPAGIDPDNSFSFYLPVFDSPENGMLPVVSLIGNDFQVGFFSTPDGGQNWITGPGQSMGSLAGNLPISLLDPQDLVAAVPNSNQIIHMEAGNLKTVINQDGMSAAIVALDMFTTDVGWAKWNSANCGAKNISGADGSTNTSCASITQLIKTNDGGITWEAISFPGLNSVALTQSYNSTYAPPSQSRSLRQANTQTFVGQGFDICTIPTLPQLQSWWSGSPYGSVNLYIGGSARACANTALTASFLSQARGQGWNFIPTWVGPQAPCRPSGARISSDANTAYTQGVAEADLAVEKLATLGLTSADKTGSVVYYDMEPYGTDSVCRAAVNAFTNGWVAELHARGNVAGMYASTSCNQGLSDFRNITNIPDVIWPYRWYHQAGQGSYSPSASVWDLGGCVPTTVWVNHQRIRQYEGAHNETWGGVTLNIDNNVLDGMVAIPYGAYIAPPSANFSATPLSGNVPLAVTFYIANTSNITGCSWNYGDGQTGSSCAGSHSHIYNSAGDYSVSLTVSGPGGSDSRTHTNYIAVSQPPPPPSQPDLVPYPHSGGVNPVIISSVTGTNTNGTLIAGQQIFIDWGFKNVGISDINTNFYVDLFIDDQRYIHYLFTNLSAGAAGGFDDWGLIWNTTGLHTVKLVVDPDSNISESNESNNVWTGQFFWGSGAAPGLTTISPSGPISEIQPAYSWYAGNSVTTYELYLYSLGSNNYVFSITLIPPYQICKSDGICTYPPSTLLSPGDYQFMVVAKDVFNYTLASSAWRTFTVGGIPPVPTTVSPTETITDNTPSYVWTHSVGASSYDLYVYPLGSTSPQISNSSLLDSSNCTTGTCIWTPSTPLLRGSYAFNVRARNLGGASDFSALKSFYVDAGDTFYRIYLPLVIR